MQCAAFFLSKWFPHTMCCLLFILSNVFFVLYKWSNCYDPDLTFTPTITITGSNFATLTNCTVPIALCG